MEENGRALVADFGGECVSALPLFRHYFWSWKCHLLFMYAAYIQMHFRLDFFIEANNIGSLRI